MNKKVFGMLLWLFMTSAVHAGHLCFIDKVELHESELRVFMSKEFKRQIYKKDTDSEKTSSVIKSEEGYFSFSNKDTFYLHDLHFGCEGIVIVSDGASGVQLTSRFCSPIFGCKDTKEFVNAK
jgi:hypothetical protein